MPGILKPQYDDEGYLIDQYDDSIMRATYCDILSLLFGGTFVSVPNKKETDIFWKDKNEYFEGEEGPSWEGNRGTNSYHRDRFNVGFYSINAPERKLPSLAGVKAENRPDLDFLIELYKNRIIHFIRGNNDKTQIFIVRAEILRDPSKYVIAKPNYAVSTATRPEHWMCIPAEYAEIYNYQLDGRYVLSTEPGGDFMSENEYKEFKRRQVLHAAKVRKEFLQKNNLTK